MRPGLNHAWRLTVANPKGGVGKTTIAASHAAVIADSSRKMPAFDADLQQTLCELTSARPLPADADFAIIPFVPESAAGSPPAHGTDAATLGLPTW
jgi:cellulose biosynthesis protein BcsQ